MEDQQFDQLTKKLAGAVSRRTVIKMVAAAALGGLFPLRKLQRADKIPRTRGMGPPSIVAARTARKTVSGLSRIPNRTKSRAPASPPTMKPISSRASAQRAVRRA